MIGKKTSLIIRALSLVGLTIAGMGLSTTFAGYVKEQAVEQQVGLQRYIFLDVTNWDLNDVEEDYYVYLFTMKTSSQSSAVSTSLATSAYLNPEAKQWYKGSLVSGESKIYWFYIPTRYEYAVFVRARHDAPLADVQAWKTTSNSEGREAVWNQTNDIYLLTGKNLYTPTSTETRTCSSGDYSLPKYTS